MQERYLVWRYKYFGYFEKNLVKQNFLKIRPVEAEWIHVGGRTDGRTDRHDEANTSFSQFLRQRLNSDLLPSVGTGCIAIEEVFKNRCLVCNIGVNS